MLNSGHYEIHIRYLSMRALSLLKLWDLQLSLPPDSNRRGMPGNEPAI